MSRLHWQIPASYVQYHRKRDGVTIKAEHPLEVICVSMATQHLKTDRTMFEDKYVGSARFAKALVIQRKASRVSQSHRIAK
jgi:hypothetical protein